MSGVPVWVHGAGLEVEKIVGDDFYLCGRQGEGCGARQEMMMSEYCAWWRQHHDREHVRTDIGTADDVSIDDVSISDSGTDGAVMGTTSDTGARESSLDGSGDSSLLYLKDWHFSTDFPGYKARAPFLPKLHFWYSICFTCIETAKDALLFQPFGVDKIN